jgi:hypothetical protein
MRQRMLIIGAGAVVVIALLVINAASYVKITPVHDTEAEPDRSTYNAGPTGTRALYDYLQESGHRVMRWQEPTSELNNVGAATHPAVWVIVGEVRKEFADEEVADILRWVKSGGRLVLIDRLPPKGLVAGANKWHLRLRPSLNFVSVRPGTVPGSLTTGVPPAVPAQPTLLVQGVDQVQASRLASSIEFTRDSAEAVKGSDTTVVNSDEDEDEDRDDTGPPPPKDDRGSGSGSDEPNPVGPPQIKAPTENSGDPSISAPVVQLSQNGLPLMVDYQLGAGRVIVLADPYIVTNAGINAADNLLLAQNLVASKDGLIAFDEYHQGRAISQNHLAAYFAGTPVLPILAQLAFIVIAVVWTRSRRFGRSLPLVQSDRRSKLEYVASMAELQQRSRAYDLAIENIYLRTRRALARYAGVDGNTPRATIAQRVAARSKLDPQQIETVMRQCEDAINGDPISAKQALSLVARLRDIENALGLRLRQREAKQARQL